MGNLHMSFLDNFGCDSGVTGLKKAEHYLTMSPDTGLIHETMPIMN